MRGSGSNLALLTRSKFGKITVVVSLPGWLSVVGGSQTVFAYAHLVVKDLGLSGLGLGNEGVIKNVENILANLLELCLDLLSVVADGANVLLGALGLLLLLDRGDDAPGSASRADHVLVSDREQVTLVNSQFATNLYSVKSRHAGGQALRVPAGAAGG